MTKEKVDFSQKQPRRFWQQIVVNNKVRFQIFRIENQTAKISTSLQAKLQVDLSAEQEKFKYLTFAKNAFIVLLSN